MTELKREQLKRLMIIKKRNESRRPKHLSYLPNNIKMPHERKVEIGDRILKEKILQINQ